MSALGAGAGAGASPEGLEFLEQLGSGSFGDVLRAHLPTGEQWAVEQHCDTVIVTLQLCNTITVTLQHHNRYSATP
jgi:hypothetical protein